MPFKRELQIHHGFELETAVCLHKGSSSVWLFFAVTALQFLFLSLLLAFVMQILLGFAALALAAAEESWEMMQEQVITSLQSEDSVERFMAALDEGGGVVALV